MLKIKIAFFLFCTSLFFQSIGQTSDSLEVKTLTLQFENIDLPPSCFFSHKKLKKAKVALALSGGGARGFAQIGVLEVFEENDIPIDLIIGTSMGSIVGGLYASGYSAKEILAIARSIDWDKIMIDKSPRTNLFIGQKQERNKAILQLRFSGFKLDLPQAITPGQTLTSILTKLTLGADFKANSDFDHLDIPFRALACDLVSGKKYLLKDGNLAEAMKASSAVPLLFEPVAIDNLMLVDGGLINNIPVDEAQEFDVDLIIGLDTTAELNDKNQLNVPWKIADQVTSIMQAEKNDQQRQKADILIKPDLSEFSSDAFGQIDSLVAAGKREARKHIDKIKNMLKIKNNYSVGNERFFVNDVKFSGFNYELRDIAEDVIQTSLDSIASLDDVYLSMKKIYQTGYFRDIRANCIFDDSLLSVHYFCEANPIFMNVRVINNTVFSDSLILSQLESKSGKPINYFQSKNDLHKISNLYKERGYSFFNIDNVSLKNDSLEITVNEGIISSVEIENNHRTKDFVILREFPLKKGNIFNINELEKGINNIFSTNLFKRVSLNVSKESNQAKIIIKVKEKAFTLARFSFRYDLERKNKAMVELIDENFLGVANPLTFHAQYGMKDQLFKFRYRSDRIFKTFLTNSFDVYHQRYRNYVYSNGKKTGEYLCINNGTFFSIGRQIERLGILSLIVSVNDIQLKSISGYGYPTANYDLKTITLQSIVDTQDRYPFPATGKYYLFFYKFSSASFLNSQMSYFKLFSSLEFYHSF
ncbi:hypothetical protein B6I21_00705, partial [candidate division KSB1 bacterium 4572_119]